MGYMCYVLKIYKMTNTWESFDKKIQDKWISKKNNFYPFKIIDEIGTLVIYISETLENKPINMESFHPLFDGKINKKIIDNFNIILTGLIVGTTINLYLQNEG